jgi:hypothetical protein
MRQALIALGVIALLVVTFTVGRVTSVRMATPTNIVTPTSTITATSTATSTEAATPTETATPTSTATPTATATPTETPDPCSEQVVRKYHLDTAAVWEPVRDIWNHDVLLQLSARDWVGAQRALWEYLGALNTADNTLRPMQVPDCLFSAHSWYLRALPEYAAAGRAVQEALDTDDLREKSKFIESAHDHMTIGNRYVDRGNRMVPSGW